MTAERFNAVLEIGTALASARDVDALLTLVIERLSGLLSADAATLFVHDAEADALVSRVLRGGGLKELRLNPRDGIVGHVFQTGETLLIPDAYSDGRFNPEVDRQSGFRTRSIIAAPLRHVSGHLLGVVEVMHSKVAAFNGEDRALVEAISAQIAGVLDNVLLVETLRAQNEQLRAALGKERLAAVGQMLSGVLHDLRTPMTIISGYTQLLAEEESAAERAQLAKRVEKQVEHISAMTRETLAFARGERELLVRKVYLQHFCREVEEYLRKEFEPCGVELRMKVSYAGTVRADENKLKRVVYNIARNAAQAMPGGGRFTLTVERDADILVLRFEDTGPGVPPEIADRLFESFVTAGKSGGSGLGLAIVKRIVDAHGGTVSFRSRRDEGTTFEVRLPLGG